MSDLNGALCTGKWWLFESVEMVDHMEARELCADCPVIAGCRDVLATTVNPVGTWAGRLFGSRAKPREHATERGYQQHKTNGEARCAPCQQAHAEHERARYARLAG